MEQNKRNVSAPGEESREYFGIQSLRGMTPGGRKRLFRFTNYRQYESARANARRIRRDCPREDGWIYDFTFLPEDLIITVKLLPPGAAVTPQEGSAK